MANTELNIRSEKVSVFPATRRAFDKQEDSRFFSEQNVSKLTNKLLASTYRTDTNNLPYRNFVMTRSFTTTQEPIEFIIQGYYFKINKIQDILDLFTASGTQYTDIYAFIRLDTFNDLPEIAGQDVEVTETNDDNEEETHMEYTGLMFSNTYAAADKDYTVRLLTKSGSTVEIPQDSYTIFDEYTIDVNILDGGDIDA